MSRLEDLSNQIKARAEQIATRIQDSELYQKLADRYQALSPQGQKLTSLVVIVLIALFVLYTPFNAYLESNSLITTFEDQRALIKDLFKTYREAKKDAGISVPPPADMLIRQINSQLQSNHLLPEQIVSVNQGSFEGRLIPEKFVLAVVNVSLAKLNLRQIVDLGNVLNRLSESVKMKDLNISARTDMNGYFDVTYKMYALNVPEAQIQAAPELEEPSNNRSRSNREKKSDGDSDSGDE